MKITPARAGQSTEGLLFSKAFIATKIEKKYQIAKIVIIFLNVLKAGTGE
jgi:hypothetical protein